MRPSFRLTTLLSFRPERVARSGEIPERKRRTKGSVPLQHAPRTCRIVFTMSVRGQPIIFNISHRNAHTARNSFNGIAAIDESAKGAFNSSRRAPGAAAAGFTFCLWRSPLLRPLRHSPSLLSLRGAHRRAPSSFPFFFSFFARQRRAASSLTSAGISSAGDFWATSAR